MEHQGRREHRDDDGEGPDLHDAGDEPHDDGDGQVHRRRLRAPRLRGSKDQKKGAAGGDQQRYTHGPGVDQDAVVLDAAQPAVAPDLTGRAQKAHEPELCGHGGQTDQSPVDTGHPLPSRAVETRAGVEDLRAHQYDGEQHEKGAQGLVLLGQRAGRSEQERSEGGRDRGGGEPGGQSH